MAANPTKITSHSRIRNGKLGLITTPGKITHVTIDGTGFVNGQDVKVFDPPTATDPKWTGKVRNAKSDHCKSRLKIAGSITERPRDGDTVRVTVDDVPISPNPTIPTGQAPILLDGVYSVACAATGSGNFKWLAPVSDDNDVKLDHKNDPAPNWVFTMVDIGQANCFSIQCFVDGVAYYLSWSNNSDGTTTDVAIVEGTGDGTNWQLEGTGVNIKAINHPSTNPTPHQPYLNGDISAGTVNMSSNNTPSGTNWTTEAAFRLAKSTS